MPEPSIGCILQLAAFVCRGTSLHRAAHHRQDGKKQNFLKDFCPFHSALAPNFSGASSQTACQSHQLVVYCSLQQIVGHCKLLTLQNRCLEACHWRIVIRTSGIASQDESPPSFIHEHQRLKFWDCHSHCTQIYNSTMTALLSESPVVSCHMHGHAKQHLSILLIFILFQKCILAFVFNGRLSCDLVVAAAVPRCLALKRSLSCPDSD